MILNYELEQLYRMYEHESNLAKIAEAYFLAANMGNATAQFHLALLYAYGIGVVQNNAKAEEWYRKAALQGHADAQHHLVILLTEKELQKSSEGLQRD
ncbi:tetratricopeptide repeat protein [Heliophilum fasciatum]|nr:SEL1-like repeat protein [Heliophilum fasciatum]MCW2279390.1 TPR repeat protein [Heliophilum fasciatum]